MTTTDIEASLLASWGQCLHDEVELPTREVRQYGCSGDLQNIRTWETTSNMECEVRQELELGGPQSFTATPMDDNAPSETPPVIPDTPVVTFDSHMPPVTTSSISQPSCRAVNSSDSPLAQHPRVPDFKTSLAAGISQLFIDQNLLRFDALRYKLKTTARTASNYSSVKYQYDQSANTRIQEELAHMLCSQRTSRFISINGDSPRKQDYPLNIQTYRHKKHVAIKLLQHKWRE